MASITRPQLTIIILTVGLLLSTDSIRDGLLEYLRSSASILAIHGNLIAGAIAFIGALITVKQIQHQMEYEKSVHADEAREKALSITRIICEEIESFFFKIDHFLLETKDMWDEELEINQEYEPVIGIPKLPPILSDQSTLARLSNSDYKICKKIRSPLGRILINAQRDFCDEKIRNGKLVYRKKCNAYPAKSGEMIVAAKEEIKTLVLEFTGDNSIDFFDFNK